MKDGRAFSYFIESWLEKNYPLNHIKGCKKFDFKDENFPDILYDEKTFTNRGCNFCPPNILGQGRNLRKKSLKKNKKNDILYTSKYSFSKY